MEKKKIKSIAYTLTGAIVGYLLVNQFLFTKSFDEQMMKIASEFNKHCPIMVDKETRIDNAVALPENTFQYNYTLINLVRSEIDTSLFSASIKQNILNTIKTNPDLKPFRDNNAKMAYNYKDKNGIFIYKFVFGPKDYK